MSLFNAVFNSTKESLKSVFNKRLEHWLSRRVPGSFEHSLTSRNIFILPTKFGFAFLFFVLLLILLGTNYQNNTILLLSYLLASLFITVMLHSFYNLSQLKLSSTEKHYIFAEQQAFLPITIKAEKSHFDLNIHYVKKSSLPHKKLKIEQCSLGENKVLVPCSAKKRGVYNIGRVKIYSEYSLGFFITWSMLDFSHQLIVYPNPKQLRGNHDYLSNFEDNSDNKNVTQSATTGIDDFSELKNHIVGESQARVAWKQLARGQGKLSKHYDDQQGTSKWLKLIDMPSNNLETKLSYLCFLILEYSKNGTDFGLVLDSSYSVTINKTIKIAPSSGHQHQQHCLVALAKFTHSEVD
jgi:uncharacterized protein (DUF58 family)